MTRRLTAALVAVLMLLGVSAAWATHAGERIDGVDRYELSVNIAKRFWEPGEAGHVYIANGATMDAATAGPSVTDGPILLVRTGTTLPAVVEAELKRLAPEYGVVAIGGSGSVSDAQIHAASIAAGFAEPAPAAKWPDASNTGVPDGTVLTAYTGPTTITTANTVIRDKVVNARLNIQAANVQIVNSRINGTVEVRYPRTTNHSFSIVDSEVHIGDTLNTGLGRGNYTATRVEVTGGRRSMYCEINCTVEDSWVHAQGDDLDGDAHFSGIRMGENTTLRGNTITCEALRAPGTGCSAGLTGYGDFSPVQNNLIEGNIFLGGGGGGSTVCAYGGSSGDEGGKPYGHLANNIRFVDNVFVRGETGKCGNLRATLDFDPTRPGNVWSGNTWDDGSPINYTE